MNENLRNYLSADEQKQIDALIGKALHRKEKKKASAGQKQFRYFVCQCIGMEDTEGKENEDVDEPWEEEAYFEVEIERILREVCGFCLKNGLCPCAYEEGVRKKKECTGTVADEELPF